MYEMSDEQVARSVDALLRKLRIVCLNCGRVRDVEKFPRIDAGACSHCTYVGWAPLSDPGLLTYFDTKEQAHA